MQRVKLLAVFLLSAGCAAASSGSNRPSASGRGVLTATEISQSSATTAYELIAQLRPEYLRSRGISSLQTGVPQGPVVYLDNVQLGTSETLRTINTESISLVEYLGAGDATTRFGTDHTGGAILIFTKR